MVTRDEEIHYVFQNTQEEQDDPEQREQYILGGGELPSSLENVICPDGSTAVLVNGEYFLAQFPEDQTQTMLLRGEDEGFTQYFYETADGLAVSSDDNIIVNNAVQHEDSQIVQFVEDETPDVASAAAEDSQNVIYYTTTALEDESSSMSNDLVFQQGNMVPDYTEMKAEVDTETMGSVQDEEGNIYPFKRVRFGGHQLLNLEDVIAQQNALFLQQNEEDDDGEVERKPQPNIEFHQDGVHYTLIGNENYQFCTYTDDSNPLTAAAPGAADVHIIDSYDSGENNYYDITTPSDGPKSRTVQQPIEKENRNPQPSTTNTTTTVTISPITGVTTRPQQQQQQQQPIILPDTSKIFGRNVVTGQTITLDDYIEKLKKKPIDFLGREKSRRSTKKPELVSEQIRRKSLSALLDKKISIGTTKNGKRLVGKIIKVGRKNADETEQEHNNTTRVVRLHQPELSSANSEVGMRQSELRPATSEVGSNQSHLTSAMSQVRLHQSESSSEQSAMALPHSESSSTVSEVGLPHQPEVNSQPTPNVRFLTRINVQGTQILLVEDAPFVETQSQVQIEEIHEQQGKVQLVAHNNLTHEENEADRDVSNDLQENATADADDVTMNADHRENKADDVMMKDKYQDNEDYVTMNTGHGENGADYVIINTDHHENGAGDVTVNEDHQEGENSCSEQGEQQQQEQHQSQNDITTAAPPGITDGLKITRDLSERPATILIERRRLSDECFEQISKTLGGVMEMEQVCHQLQNRNIVVKVIEKAYVKATDSFKRNKNSLYLYGYMAKYGQEEEDEVSAVINGEIGNAASSDGGNDGSSDPQAKWRFVPDLPILAAILRGDLDATSSVAKYPTVANVTISITSGRLNRRTVKVNWNPTVGNLCAMCARFFKSNAQLRKHMATVHTNNNNNNRRRRHGNQENKEGSSESCQVADGVAHGDANVSTNEGTISEDANGCEMCSKGFVDFDSLQKKATTRWPKRQNSTLDNAVQNPETTFLQERVSLEHRKIHMEGQEAGTGDDLFVCHFCQKVFPSQPYLVAHLSTCDTRQIVNMQQRPLECSLCEVRCADLVSLKKHLLTHNCAASDVMVTTSEDPSTVNLATLLGQSSQEMLSTKCSNGSGNRRFVNVQFVNSHKKRKTPGSYSNVQFVSLHKKRKNPGSSSYVEQNFICNVCSRTFSRHSNLMRHAEVHKGEGNSYKCSICYCSYNYISSLTRHIVDHHIKKNQQVQNKPQC